MTVQGAPVCSGFAGNQQAPQGVPDLGFVCNDSILGSPSGNLKYYHFKVLKVILNRIQDIGQ